MADDTEDKIKLADTDTARGAEPFTITCKTCGSTDVEYRNDMNAGSSVTGPWGEMYLICRNCKAMKILYAC